MLSGSALARCFASLGLWLAFAGRLGAVVISEIHHNPPPGDENLEFVELANDSWTPEDLSGYSFSNGIVFTLPPRTILPSRGFLVICADADAVKARYGIQNATGNFEGRLDSGGDRITLVTHAGVVVQSLRFRDRGKWPSAPDGTGHTLSLRDVHLDSSEPESWAPSLELGGTPGRANFAGSTPQYEERVIVGRGTTWRYARGTGPFSTPETAWREPGFVDSGWAQGPSGFGYGDGDDATELLDMLNTYVTVAIRRHFSLTAQDLQAEGDFYLGIDYDDGFCAFLNGSEVMRINCGAAGENLPWDAIATGAREAGIEEAFLIPRNLLVAGDNVVAIVGHNFAASSSDFSLIPRVLHRRLIPVVGGTLTPIVFNELHRGASPGQGWVELYNTSRASFDLSGYRLTDDPARNDPHVLPAGSVVGGNGFLALTDSTTGLVFSAAEVHLFLLAPGGACPAASVFDRDPPSGSPPGGWSEARFPDGGPLEWVTRTPTQAAANAVERVTDIVINEIFYHPPEERAGEFIELHNRGAAAVDISGFRFDNGIDFTFPPGTVIEAGGYLVVAEDPAILSQRWGFADALGPYTGRLANDGENVRLVDADGNLADEVRYAEGGHWSRWADGGGASLELIDPEQDNWFGTAWDASDESSKTQWELLAFQVPSYTAAADSELHLFLAERGTCRIDDVSIKQTGGAANLIPNPGFEAGTAPWVIDGTHIASRRVTADKHSGSAALEVEASSKGDMLVNRIEVETSPRMTAGQRYDVSLWARWVRGGSLLVLHGECTSGAYGGRPPPAIDLSGNSLSAGLRLAIPWNIGTPGAENSARRALRTSTGSDNLGPVFAGLEHDPPSPAPGQPASVTVRVSDSDGVASVLAFRREGSPAGAFASVPLSDDGLHRDGAAGDGLYGGDIPGGVAGARIVFYIEARDTLGAMRRFPLDAPQGARVLQVQGPVNGNVDNARLVMDTAQQTLLETRALHSNDLVSGTFVFNDEEVYYNVGIRYRGSPWGRPGRSNFRVRFEDDRPFHRGRKAMNLDNSGPDPREGAAYFLGVRNSGAGVAAPGSDYGWIATWYVGQALGLRGLLQPVDRQFLSDWYGDAEAAIAHKVEGRRQFNDGQDLAGQWDGGSFIYRTDNKENYRSYFIPALRRSVDDWTSFMAMTRVMDTRLTSNAVFDTQIDSVLDVEAFLRVLSPRILQADWDAFCVGNGHNGYLVLDPRDGRWELLPHDMDNSFGDANATLFPASDPYVARLMARPLPRRTYYRILWEYINGYWSSSGAGPYFDAVGATTGQDFNGIKGYLDASGAKARNAVLSSTTVAFRIITNGGSDITTDATSIELQGDASVQVASLGYQRNSGVLELFQPTWSTHTRWKATFPLPEAQNRFDFIGFDGKGDITATARINITSTAQPSGPTVGLYFPMRSSVFGGAVVTFTGDGFVPEMRILFGGVESPAVEFLAADAVRADVPPGGFPIPADGRVDIELIVSPASRTVLAKGFTYTLQTGFVRGDVSNDREVDIQDPLAILFHLFRGTPILCPDAADVDDSGAVNLADAVAALSYLFRSGTPPAAPFPGQGSDSTADGLSCPE